MLINRATEYAVLGLLYLSNNSDGPVDVEEISKHEKISKTYLEKVFQKMSEKKLVKPQFGPGGGFTLAIEPEKISIFQLMEIFQGEQMGKCLNFKERQCNRKAWCPMRKVLNKGKNLLFTYFKTVTLQDLINK